MKDQTVRQVPMENKYCNSISRIASRQLVHQMVNPTAFAGEFVLNSTATQVSCHFSWSTKISE